MLPVSVAPAVPKIAFREVYRAHMQLVLRTLARSGVREADVRDLAQNVFIVVHRQLPGFEGRAAVATWLVAICRLVAKDYRRSATIRREVVVDAGELAELEDNVETPDVDTRESSRLLAVILERIPEKLRLVLVMFEIEEKSGGEIARLLEVPEGTVRSRLRLARAALKREAIEELSVHHC